MMKSGKPRVLAILVGICTVAASSALGQAAGGLQDGQSVAPPRDVDHALARLSAEARRVYDYVKPAPNEDGWRKIPWLTDVLEAIRIAEAEKRPILLFVSDGEPLDRC
jgi:hypothetical protein